MLARIFYGLIVLLGVSAVASGNKELNSQLKVNVTISVNLPPNGLICVDKNITFTCHTPTQHIAHVTDKQYVWSINGGKLEIGGSKYTIRVPSQSAIKVSCEVTVKLSSGAAFFGNNSIIVHNRPNGTVPQIQFEGVSNNFVYKLSRSPFSLTATVVSDLNLTSLYWSPPEYVGPIPNTNTTVHHGSITTTTFTSLKNASLGDSGNYTLTAVNECGQSSLQVDVVVLTDCPSPKFTEVQPKSFTAVEGYNTTLKYSFNGFYSLSSSLRIWALLPHSQSPVWLDEYYYSGCGCWVEHQFACSVGTNPNDCCRFELTVHSIPHVNESGTVFFSTKNFTDEEAAWMYVVPRPKVLEPPSDLNTTVGSKAIFTCDFETTTDTKIAQIHWLFNDSDLAGCNRFKDRINCTVTQQSTDKNYISSTLTIYPVQADNVGQYTCYCSYDISLLSVGGIEVIESDHKSATLAVQSGSSHGRSWYIIAGGIAGGVAVIVIVIIIIIIVSILKRRVCGRHSGRNGYISVPGDIIPESSGEKVEIITDEMLDRYVVKELHEYWEKIGKGLHLEEDFSQESFDNSQVDPAKRLKLILRKWRDTAERPSLATLNGVLKNLGLKDFIPGNKMNSGSFNLQLSGSPISDHQLPVGGPGPQVGINGRARILPGMSSRQTEIKAFQGILRCGLPPLPTLTPDLQEEWKELGRHMGLQPLDLRRIEQQYLSQTIECCWAVCNQWLNLNMAATWDDLLEKLHSISLQWNSIASGLYQYLKSLLVDTDSRPKNKKKMCAIIMKHYEEIVNHVNPEQLLVQLKPRGLVTQEEEYMLLNTIYSPQKRTKLLLLSLHFKNPNSSVILFHECLRAEKEHSGHEYLADLLESDICKFQSQHQVPNSRGTSNSNTAGMTESEIDNILPTLTFYWMQVAEKLNAPQEMIKNITTSSQDPEEQARMFLQQYIVYARKENIYRVLNQLDVNT